MSTSTSLSANQRGFAPILIVLIITVLALGGFLLWTGKIQSFLAPIGLLNRSIQPSNPNKTACTLEAKLCPDGTSVGRTGPKCEFAACPPLKESTSSADISTWKTIKLQSNFEVKYPQTWDFYKVAENNITFGPKELVQTNREKLDNPNFGALIGGKAWPVEIKPLNTDSYYYSSNEVSFISDAQKKVSSKNVNIDGIEAVKYIIIFEYDAPYISKGDIIEVIVAKKASKTFSITLSDPKYKDIFNQILSTFKFLP